MGEEAGEEPMRIAILTLLVMAISVGVAFARGDFQEIVRKQGAFYVYRDNGSSLNHGAPSGWMGDYRDLIVDEDCRTDPHLGKSCIRINYTAKGSKYADWAGILWQYPPNNWGDLDGGIDLTGATKLTFWARGECGGEIINAFKFGGVLGAYPDTGSAHITRIELGRQWARYEINLTDIDISYISSFFTVVMNKISNPDGCTIYLDDIRLE